MNKRNILISAILPLSIVIILSWAMIDTLLVAKPRTAYAVALPTSRITTDRVLEEVNNLNGGDIEKIEFLNIDGSDNIELSDEVMTNVLGDPEFRKQVEALKSETDKSGMELPPLGVLVSLFLMGSLALGGVARNGREYVNVDLGKKLSDFFSFETVKKTITKVVDIVKKVPVYTQRVVKEVVKKVIQVPKQVAYTAYETVKKVSYKTKTWVENIVRPKPQHPVDALQKMTNFMKDTFAKYPGSFDRDFQRNGRYYLNGLYSDRDFETLKKDFDDVRSGRKVGRFSQNVNRTYSRGNQNVRNMMYGFLKNIEATDPKTYAIVKAEYDNMVAPTFVQKIVHTVTEPIVNLVRKPYTAYRTEYDSVEIEETVEHVVTDVSYKEVTEQKTVNEVIEEKHVVPLTDKIGLALNYVRNLGRIKSNPSNRFFGDSLNGLGRGTPFEGLQKQFKNIQVDLQNAMRAGSHPSNEAWQNVAVQGYNHFVKSIKLIAYNARKSGNPIEALLGKVSTTEIIDREQYIAANKASIANLQNLKAQLLASWPDSGSKLSTARMKYEYFSDEIRTLNHRVRDSEKKLEDIKTEYKNRTEGLLDQIDRLAYLKDINTMKELDAASEITFGLGNYSPELAVGGSRPVFAGYSTGAQALYAATGGLTNNFVSAELGIRPSNNDTVAVAAKPIQTLQQNFAIASIIANTDTYPGPGNLYGSAIGNVKAGENVKIIGRLKENNWLQIELQNGKTAWIYPTQDIINLGKGLNTVPVVALPIAPYDLYEKQKLDKLTSQIPYGPETAKQYFNSWEFQQYIKGILSFETIKEIDFAKIANKFDIEESVLRAVVQIESGGSGFYADGSIKLRFEGHQFKKYLELKGLDIEELINDKYDDVIYSYSERNNYKHGVDEYNRAIEIDKESAMLSTSFGAFQIMGFNYKNAGYETVENFVKAQYSYKGQVEAFTSYIASNKNLLNALKEKNFTNFAKLYNGAGYAANQYDVKIQNLYDQFSSEN